jgi:Fe-S oxidoreductase
MASGDEYKTTRARANLMREMLNRCSVNEFYKSREVYEILAECLSCKGCKSECPSGIDMAKYKAEFLQHYYDAHGTPMRTRLFAGIKSTYALFSSIPWLFNAFANGGLLKMSMGLAPERHLPKLSKTTLVKWFRNEPANTAGRTLILYADEFTNYTDVHIGIAAVNLLCSLGYNVKLSKCMQSGRAQFSKGLLRKAKGIAEKNVTHFSELVNENCPLVGLEPSALMCFRDEYPDLVASEQKASAKELARHCFTFDEFIAQEFKSGNIEQSMFTEEKKVIRFHGHCYQKASSGTSYTKDILSIPRNYNVSEINSGCCGMAGSFGFEKEHYELSMQIGELKLFPTVRESAQETMIVAAGTSCRQHIGEGTGRTALHPAEVLYLSLKPNLNK